MQATWVRALEQRPRSLRNPLAWLAQVLRNEARQAGRAQARATRRENARARPEAVPAASEVVTRLALQRQLLDAVGALDPIYRDVVYLRCFEELPPRTIAARLGLPRRTVDTRLTRALAQLRTRLDGAHGGDRRAWLGGAIALAGLRGPLLPLALGAAFMQTKFVLVGAAVLAAATIYLLSGPARDDGVRAPAAPDGGVATALPGDSTDRAKPTTVPGPRTPVPVATPSPPASEPAIRGLALDARALPAGGMRAERDCFVYGQSEPEGDTWPCQARGISAITGPDGSFELRDIASHGIVLRLGAQEILITDEFRFEGDRVVSPIDIRVQLCCQIRDRPRRLRARRRRRRRGAGCAR